MVAKTKPQLPFVVPYSSCGRRFADCDSYAEIPTAAHPNADMYGGAWGTLPQLIHQIRPTDRWERCCGDVQNQPIASSTDSYRFPYWLWLCGDCCKRAGLIW